MSLRTRFQMGGEEISPACLGKISERVHLCSPASSRGSADRHQVNLESQRQDTAQNRHSSWPEGCCLVTKSCSTLCDPMDCSMPGLPVLHHLPESAQTMSIESVMPSNHLILCRPLFFLPSIFPSIRVFSNESALRIR